MKIRIAKTFDFDAAHWLPNVHTAHKCHRMHGHTYRVELVFEGLVDERGMVLDYQEVSDQWAPIHARLDHRVLNEIDGLRNPTTEVLAPWIAAQLAHMSQLVAVRVYESATTYCEVML